MSGYRNSFNYDTRREEFNNRERYGKRSRSNDFAEDLHILKKQLRTPTVYTSHLTRSNPAIEWERNRNNRNYYNRRHSHNSHRRSYEKNYYGKSHNYSSCDSEVVQKRQEKPAPADIHLLTDSKSTVQEFTVFGPSMEDMELALHGEISLVIDEKIVAEIDDDLLL